MTEFALTTIAFSIGFILFGGIGTRLRRSRPDGRPIVFLEVFGWASGGLMLGWTTVTIGLQRYAPGIFESRFGLFVFLATMFGTAVATSGILWNRLDPVTEPDQSDTPPDPITITD